MMANQMLKSRYPKIPRGMSRSNGLHQNEASVLKFQYHASGAKREDTTVVVGTVIMQISPWKAESAADLPTGIAASSI